MHLPQGSFQKTTFQPLSFGYDVKKTCYISRGKAKDAFKMGIKEEKFIRVKLYSSRLIVAILML